MIYAIINNQTGCIKDILSGNIPTGYLNAGESIVEVQEHTFPENVPAENCKVESGVIVEMTPAEKLNVLKYKRKNEIDKHTVELISQGFEYRDKQFSLSLAAQINLTAAFETRALQTYPIKWSTIDNKERIEIEDDDEMQTFALVALAAKRSILDVGNELKDDIEAATTVDAVNAITDER